MPALRRVRLRDGHPLLRGGANAFVPPALATIRVVPAGPAPRSPFGGPVVPRRALEEAAARLADWYRAGVLDAVGRLPLQPADPSFPDVTLSLAKDRRLFSRTLQLMVVADTAGDGPEADGALALRIRRLFRRHQLEWKGAAPPDGDRWRVAFVDAGLVRGAATMTNVRELRLGYASGEHRWSLRLVTLAGALIGTSPGAGIVVPLEPEDVDGLLQVLRAFVAGARGVV